MRQCKIKICGLSHLEDIWTANEIMPDYIGFVFAKSRRQISREQAVLLRGELKKGIQAVGVFVNAPQEEILSLTEDDIIDVVQLHGDEDESYMCSLRQRTKKPIIKAVRAERREQILRAQSLPCDYLLLDTFVKDRYGGSGRQFDWDMIPELSRPYFLAGGISLENLREAMARGPYCIDLSSAVETDGCKDPEKMRKMMETFKKYRAELRKTENNR